MNEILFLPGTQTILSTNYDKYLSSIDSKTLLHLVQKNNMGDIIPIKEIFGGPINNDQKLIEDQSKPLTNNVELIKPDINNLKDNMYYSQFLSLNEQIKIVEIDDFGPLYEKGVRENDIILEINEEEGTWSNLTKSLRFAGLGSDIKLKLLSKNNEFKVINISPDQTKKIN